MIHRLKIKKEYAEEIIAGNKMFEIRFNDRNYQKGDEIIFKVIDEEDEYEHLEYKIFEITYVLAYFPDGLRENYVILGIKERKWGQKDEEDI